MSAASPGLLTVKVAAEAVCDDDGVMAGASANASEQQRRRKERMKLLRDGLSAGESQAAVTGLP
jgi:hypothetical protein